MNNQEFDTWEDVKEYLPNNPKNVALLLCQVWAVVGVVGVAVLISYKIIENIIMSLFGG